MQPKQFQRALKARGEAAAILARRQWRTLGSLDEWERIASRLTSIVAAGQIGGASDAQAMLATTLGAGLAVNPEGFAGFASDGRPLRSLLYSPVVHARELFGSGRTDAQIMRAGEGWLAMHVRVQVADAGRAAASVGIASTKDAGYYRHVSPPCCQRCAVLAGKWFQWNQGFKRHPGCDCIHSPAKGGKAPDGYVQQVPLDQIRDLTDAQRQAISEGADQTRVMNAYRDTHPAQNLTAVTQARAGRLTPDGIYQRSATRDDAVALLRRYGYLA